MLIGYHESAKWRRNSFTGAFIYEHIRVEHEESDNKSETCFDMITSSKWYLIASDSPKNLYL